MSKEIISKAQVVEAMIEFVRKNLQLQDLKEIYSKGKPTITFTGRGVTKEDWDKLFALEVVVNILNSDRALSKSYFEKALQERSSQKEKTHTGFIFPRSIDYKTAKSEFVCPYLRQADLLRVMKEEYPKLAEKYSQFEYNNVKRLTRIVHEFLIPFKGSRVAYFNPANNKVQIVQLKKFAEQEIIPDNRPIQEGYFWDYVRNRSFPLDPYKKATVFRGIQEGLHDKIRQITSTENVASSFTLSSKSKNLSAKLVSYNPS